MDAHPVLQPPPAVQLAQPQQTSPEIVSQQQQQQHQHIYLQGSNPQQGGNALHEQHQQQHQQPGQGQQQPGLNGYGSMLQQNLPHHLQPGQLQLPSEAHAQIRRPVPTVPSIPLSKVLHDHTQSPQRSNISTQERTFPSQSSSPMRSVGHEFSNFSSNAAGGGGGSLLSSDELNLLSARSDSFLSLGGGRGSGMGLDHFWSQSVHGSLTQRGPVQHAPLHRVGVPSNYHPQQSFQPQFQQQQFQQSQQPPQNHSVPYHGNHGASLGSEFSDIFTRLTTDAQSRPDPDRTDENTAGVGIVGLSSVSLALRGSRDGSTGGGSRGGSLDYASSKDSDEEAAELAPPGMSSGWYGGGGNGGDGGSVDNSLSTMLSATSLRGGDI